MASCYKCGVEFHYLDLTLAPGRDINHRRHYIWCPRDKMKTWTSHAEMVTELHKRATLIKNELTEKQTDLWHGGTGVATEAGELLSTIKAHVIYQKPLDTRNVVEELGDLEFYMEQVRQCVGITREETIAVNMHKLGIRYAQGFSNAAAQERADKK